MMIEHIVPKIIKMFFKLIVGVFVFFAFINVICFLYNFPRLNSISKMVRNSAEKHGYIPYEDYKNIQAIIDAYTYQAKTNPSPLNINKVVTNLKMVVYDLSNNGYPDVASLHDYDYESQELYYIDKNNSDSVKEKKKQQGAVLFAGIYCDYLIIHPLNGWMLFDLVRDENQEVTLDSISRNSSQPYVQNSYDDNIIYDDNANTKSKGYTTFNTLNIINDNNNPDDLMASLFIEPVITSHYYPDIVEGSGTIIAGS